MFGLAAADEAGLQNPPPAGSSISVRSALFPRGGIWYRRGMQVTTPVLVASLALLTASAAGAVDRASSR